MQWRITGYLGTYTYSRSVEGALEYDGQGTHCLRLTVGWEAPVKVNSGGSLSINLKKIKLGKYSGYH